MEKQLIEGARKLSQEFLNFVNKAVSPYHAVQLAKNMLKDAQFQELTETQNWDLKKGGRYYFTRNQSTLFAFTVGDKFDPNNTGFKIVGAHTDSPCLRLAPLSQLQSQKQVQSHVTLYGGGLWHTWFDRDLTLAGKVIYKDENGKLESKLFHHQDPLFKVPNLAIHLTSADERNAFKFDKEKHLRPIFNNEIFNQINGSQFSSEEDQKLPHYRGLLNLISEQTKIPLDNIVDMDMFFVDTQPSQFFGLHKEYVSSPRLDNLYSSFFALKSMTNPEAHSNKDSSFINMLCLFDHEECGSRSFQGADSMILRDNIERIHGILSKDEKVLSDSLFKALNKSYLISADMAHAIHPNYPEKHKDRYSIQMNQGVVIKTNHNQRYASDSVSNSILKTICKNNKIPVQEFIVSNISPCGSTIGPLISSLSGVKTIDIGIAQLGMHSIRETCGIIDAVYYENLFTAFFRDYDILPSNVLNY
ncbi:hypothetical protein PPERSA_07463 [Pseudocohnilembus persalinus]|uniref:aspartyl aminopeptidase n=1 Tax=Pseudocohnilembus persalinus TaxID=266149 RepID=A0A0V0QAY5_PSEPJ|nr:hypothetical protein PPERSA_07463 [Pseudocohnilembus persalinus]|eukprot:KRW99220.1 hypothetical protein PPERSA_07463 [Pseudocohnilembus persalinus]